MSGEIEPYQSGGDDDLPVPYVPMANHGHHDAPDYVDLRPPADTELQEWWSKIVTPFRALALAFLWLTLTWWRFAIFVVFITTLFLVFATW